MRAILETLTELFQFLWQSKSWWLIPLLVVLLIFVGLVALGQATGVGPFIYTFF